MSTIPEGTVQHAESWSEKFTRRFKENPWVPLGAMATVATLITASVKMRRGESQKMNRWLRARVAAQGFTILAICGGTYLVNKREQEAARAITDGTGVPREFDVERSAQERQARERRKFEERLKEAEVHLETQGGRNRFNEPTNTGSTANPTRSRKESPP
ncbi:hypothetical protein AX15_000356 [Amanita polypyramis BW_CC]|nr:hypothetical protein AX15_000356 [Amanita polypyramis BW_CC]